MLTNIKVREWMSSPVVSVSPETLMNTAHQVMKDKRIRRLPVVKHDQLIGILSLGDIREAMPSDATSLSIWEMNGLLTRLTIEGIMTHEVITIHPEDTIFDAAELMLDHKIGGLPVVDASGELVGMLTESDIFRMVIRLYVVLSADPSEAEVSLSE